MTSGTLGRAEAVEAFSSISRSKEFYRSTPDIAPGNSGGAMFQKNAKGDYEVIGVATGTIRGFTYINFYSPIEEIQEYLKVALPAALEQKK
jgi:S1-C subfamily serine protease